MIKYVVVKLLFLCIRALPDDGWSGQPKHEVVLNEPNVQVYIFVFVA